MGLHASYHPIQPTKLLEFASTVHSESFWLREVDKYRQESTKSGQFPAPDGSTRLEAHLPSYSDEYWQAYTYVTSEEVAVIAQYLPLINEAEFITRFLPAKMKDIYRAPAGGENDNKEYYFGLFQGLQDFYKKVGRDEMAVLISIG